MSFLKRIFNNYLSGHHGDYSKNSNHPGGYKSGHHGRSRENYFNSNDAPSTKKCPFCQANIDSQARFCGQCGKDTAPASCRCGASISPGAKFCGQCGASL
ncbi:Double zinc ribbon [Legionella beliardensis]|uniref:Double zinc ribbon n=1 Tax=Legionella beliardensis TaxID=91822 RepID=A0A378JQ37_9GAMM|nr:zinc ribbon domain-containing protein [Legionella beliardensis]STX55727.1 Double zinc ribbon [Legionella beliardensis]